MTLASDISTTSTALSDIKQAIIDKGVTPTGNITTYATAIAQISGGGSTSKGINYFIQEVTLADTSKETFITPAFAIVNYTEETRFDPETIDIHVYGGYTISEVLGYSQETSDITYKIKNSPFLKEVYLLAFKTVSTTKQLSFENNTSLIKADLSGIETISPSGLINAFIGCTSLATLSFPSLTSNSFGSYTNQFNMMLKGVTGCTVHFPSNLQSVIGSWSSVTSGFGGTNTIVLFDLPATS